MKRWLCRCLVVAVALLLVAAGCSDSDGGDGDAVEASASPEVTVVPDAEATDPAAVSAAATTAAPDDVTPADEVEWATAGLDVGVRGLQVWGSSLVGTAEQSFFTSADLEEEGLGGCTWVDAGRSGEVVWSLDGLTWEALASQPLWYDGPVTVEEWAADGVTPDGIYQVALLVYKDQLFAVSSRSGGQPDGVIVEVWDASSDTWERVPGTDGVVRTVSAAAGPAGLVVVAKGIDSEPMLWTLSGGEMTRAEDPVLSELNFFGSGFLDLYASTDGFLAQYSLGGGEIVLLRSDDGREWTPVADAPTSKFTALAANGGVVIGAAGGREFWRSDDDGRTWDLDKSVPNEAIGEIAVGAHGWALYTYGPPFAPPEAIQFLPADGRRWQPIRDLSAGDVDWVTDLAVTDDGVVVVTGQSPSDQRSCPDAELSSYHAYLAAPTP